MTTIKQWVMQKAGWYTSDVGEIKIEDDGDWYFWPARLGTDKIGPFNTLKKAKQFVDEIYKPNKYIECLKRMR